MAWMEGTRKNPLPWASEAEATDHKDKLILHTSVGGLKSAINTWRSYHESSDPKKHKNLWSTFYVELDGTITQFCDSGAKANANGSANLAAVSIETEDRIHPDRLWDPWTQKQIDSFARILDFVTRHHAKVERVRCAREFGSAGLGYHSMFGAGEWNTNGHVCPGAARIVQFTFVVMPKLTGVAAPVRVDAELGGYQGLPIAAEVARLRPVLGDGAWLDDLWRSGSYRGAPRQPGAKRSTRSGDPR
jgi:hypothetical protein